MSSQPFPTLNAAQQKVHKHLCTHMCLCMCVCGTFLWSFLIASCVPLEDKDGSLRSYLLSYFIFLYIHNLTEAEIYCHSRFMHSHFDERSLQMSKNTNTAMIDILSYKGLAPDPWVLYCVVYFMCGALYND